MPQIWMTYEELAALLGCTLGEVRHRVHLDCLDRKLSRDGKKRVKLNPTITAIFLEWIKTVDIATDSSVDDLRHIHGLFADDRMPVRRTLGLSR